MKFIMTQSSLSIAVGGVSWFITGTDTEVGKTIASSALLCAANRQGWRTAGYKPVASGSEWQEGYLRNSDALSLQACSSVDLSYDEVNPYTFAEATSPHIASHSEGRDIEARLMSQGLAALRAKAEWVLVEGAGGWFTPLGDGFSFDQWVIGERLPVILVVGVKLGCINHALLTAQAVTQAGLPLVGWVANCVIAPGKRHKEYMATLHRALSAPCLGEIPYRPNASAEVLADYLDISVLPNIACCTR